MFEDILFPDKSDYNKNDTEECKACQGQGYDQYFEPCTVCNGSGEVKRADDGYSCMS